MKSCRIWRLILGLNSRQQMCIKFFRSLTTDIYSLALSSPSRSRQTLLDLKEKDLLKINYFKYYNRIIKIFVESRSSSPFLTSSATLHRLSTRADKSAYSSGPSNGLPSADPNSVHLLISFESATFSSQKSHSLTHVKKRCQHYQRGLLRLRGMLALGQDALA